jgi:ferredoxin
MKIHHDTSKCSSLGICEALAPDAFELDANSYLQILVADPPESQRAEIQAAVEGCPTGALSLTD